MLNRIINVIVILMLNAVNVSAQELSTWDFTPLEANCLKSGTEAPIDVTKEKSEKVIVYSFSNMKLPYGDSISKISFRGYNPGREISRHIRVWMKNDDSLFERDINTDVNKMTCVFDGDCTIPEGGSSEEIISLLDIPLDDPFLYTQKHFFVLRIECIGEAEGNPVCFENYEYYSRFTPIAVFTVQSPVVYYSGKVVNQDDRPVANAHVRFYDGDLEYVATSDENGCFKARVERGNVRYNYDVTAADCSDYIEDWYCVFTEGKDTANLNYMLYDAIRFKKDEPATIILPTPPDPTLGRYYRLDRYDSEPSGESHYIFEPEEVPRANVPYVVFPNHDFEIHPGDYDTKGIDPGNTCVNHPRGGGASISFQGSYQSKTLYYGLESESLFFVCMTPDCSYAQTDWGYSSQLGRIGAFRACFLINGVYHGIYNAPYSFIFNGEPTGVTSIEKYSTASKLFDLLGRRIQGEPQRKGIYVKDGKKYVKK